MPGNNALKPMTFTGPLFLIGMPRSGTKLLRGLLNSHPRIGIPVFETEFLPYWMKHWQDFGDLSVKADFMRFYKRMRKAPYFHYCYLAGELIDADVWFDACQNFTLAGVFEALVRHDAGGAGSADKIWGDKSPTYIRYLSELKEHFPDARFVHIIRDVRDYCLSIHHAWRKNMLRAAQRWADDVGGAQQAAQAFLADYMEVRYEDLLTDTESELHRICAFLDVGYEKSMLAPREETENIGAAMGLKTVLRVNKEKYRTDMPASLVRKIEEVAGSKLVALGYPVIYYAGACRIPRGTMALYKLQDGYNLARTTIRRIGIKEATKYIYGAIAVSSGFGKEPQHRQ